MPTHNSDLHEHDSQAEGRKPGFEQSDVNVSGVVVFLSALAIFVGVFFVFCFGMGKVINTALERRDGPVNRWNAIGSTPSGKGANMASNPQIQQQQLAQLTQRFPTPRVQTDDGNQDVADLHLREDLLLENYTWVDRSQGAVRIPIEHAMELIAERGLPVAQSNAPSSPLMTGDHKPEVHAPLTNGFARTAYEQEQSNAVKKAEGK